MQLGRVRLGNKGAGGVAGGAISSVLESTVNQQDLNVAIDSLEEERRKEVEASQEVEDDVKIEKSSQFDDYLDEIENDYDEEGDENEDEQEVNLNFSAMLYSSKHRVVEGHK